MKKTRITLLLMFFCVSGLNAQNTERYTTAVGVKFYPGAISFKQALSGNKSLEALAYFWNGTRITALYELHYDIAGLNGLRWYVGPGAHLQFYNNSSFSGKNYFGLDGVLGLDWKVPGAPLNLSLDWQPSFEFGEGDGFNGGFGGIGVRYVLK